MILQFVKLNNGNEDDAKDLYQESMLDFLEKVSNEKFTLTCKLRTFIYSVCRNKWLYILRERPQFVDIEDFIVIEKSLPDNREEEREFPNGEQIRNAIASLGEPCKSLLIGFYYERLNMEQLALKLNYKTSNVVKQQKFRCKDRLKQACSRFLKIDNA